MALAVYHGTVFTGDPLALGGGASVEVRKESDGTLVDLYSDRDGNTAIGNPFTADSSGRFVFYTEGVVEGLSMEVTAGAASYTLNNVQPSGDTSALLLASQSEAEAGTSNDTVMTPLRTEQHFDAKLAASLDITGALTYTSTDAGSAVGPVFTFLRDSASPAAFDQLGKVLFAGKNSADEQTTYGDMTAFIVSPTDSSETGGFLFSGRSAGAGAVALAIKGHGVLVGDVSFAVSNNPAAGYLQAQSGIITPNVELGATDTTLARASAGDVNIEGNIIYRAGGTDVPITDGGTGASTAAGAFSAIKQAATTTATGVVEKSTSAENIDGTSDTVYPTVAGTKEMIDTHGGGGGSISAAMIWYDLAKGTNGPGFTNGDWRTIQFDQESDPDSIVLLSSNQLRFAATGTYVLQLDVFWKGGNGAAHIRLRNTDGAADVEPHTNWSYGGNVGQAAHSWVVVVTSATDDYEFQVYPQSNNISANDDGNVDAPTGYDEVYHRCSILKVA